MKEELISIIIPVYNVEKYLERCVKSVIGQTFHNIEIILVDDGSTDNSPKICDSWTKKDNRVHAIHCQNGGLSFARNVGLDIAAGRFVLFVDSDDYIERDACEQLIKRTEEDVDIVIGACRQIRDRTICYQRHTNLQEDVVYDAKEYVIKSIIKNEWYAPSWLNLYKRSFLVKNGLKFKNGTMFEDLELLPRLFLLKPRVVYVDYPFYNYVIREGSITTSEITSDKQMMIISILEEWLSLYNRVRDKELQRYLYGALIKQYLYSCRVYRIIGWRIKGLDFKFACRYALGTKEAIKAILFDCFSNIHGLNRHN